MIRFATLSCVFVAVLGLAAAGCADQACQSGPKYGTQCYNSAQQPTYSSSPGSTTQPASAPPSNMPTTPVR